MSIVPPGSYARFSPAQERRRHPRCRIIDSLIIPVQLGQDRRGLLVDLSLAGASVQPYGILQPGESSSMQFTLPEDGTRFEATGVVTWSNASGRVGMQFTAIADAARRNLSSWIEDTKAKRSELPTRATSQVAAAYLPSSYSPWIKLNDTIKAGVAQDVTEDMSSLDLVSALRLLLDRARNQTRATGAAIALADGRDIVCRARAGVAPDLGARFTPDSGLSGEAVRTGATVVCTDTNEDERVDRVACERLNIRSVLIEPILSANVVIGVVEVFSSAPKAFNDAHIGHVKRVAELISAMLDNSADIKPHIWDIQ